MGGATTKALLVTRQQNSASILTCRLETLGLIVTQVIGFSNFQNADVIIFAPDLPADQIRSAAIWRKNNLQWVPLIALLGPDQDPVPCLQAGCDITLALDLADDIMQSQIEALNRTCRTMRGPLSDHDDYLRIFHAIRHPILVLSPDQTILAVNREAEKSTGMSSSEIEGKTCFSVFHGTDTPAENCPLISLLERGSKVPVDMISEIFGTTSIVSVTPILDRAGKVERIIHISTDVTERINAEQKLIRKQADYQLLADTTDDLIFVHGLDGKLTYLNRAGLEFFGIDVEQVPGTSIADYVAPEYQELLVSHQQESISGSKYGKMFDIKLIDKLGQQVTMEVKTAPIVQDGRIRGILLTARDNRERRKIHAQLLQAQKMEAVGRLAAGVAHDFNNLLTAILGNCDLVQADIESGGDPREGLDEIQIAAQNACTLTQRMLSFSRRQTSMTRVIDLNIKLRDMEKMLRRVIGEDIDILVAGTSEALTVRADPVQFEQVILNLAINARDAMPDGGELSFGLRTVHLDDASARAHPGLIQGEYHELSVSDTGSGMTKEVRQKVFEPFFTTKAEGHGTGLGLSTVHDILHDAGGQILVYSEKGKGTTFRLFWPPSEQVADQTEDIQTEHLQGKSETILLVEDERIVRDMVKNALQRAGYKVIEAPEGLQAIQKASEHDGPINLVLTDIVLPGGRNGPQVAKQIEGLHPGIKTIHMSGYSGDIIFNRTGDISSNLIQKPFSLHDLLSTVRRVLDS